MSNIADKSPNGLLKFFTYELHLLDQIINNMVLTLFKHCVHSETARLAGAVKCTDCISTESQHTTSVLDMTLNNLMMRLQ